MRKRVGTLDNSIQVSIVDKKTRSLIISPQNTQLLGLSKRENLFLRFGIRSIPVEIETAQNIAPNQAVLSNDIQNYLKIPQHCDFDFRLNERDELQFGPYIGLLAGSSLKSVEKWLGYLSDYVHHYKDIRGAILVFSLDKVDRENLSIEGYLYNPTDKEWEKGKYPYPSSIFILAPINLKWMNYFQEVLGDTIFNNFYYNKWSIHKRLASSSAVKDYLPPSILYQKPSDIYSFLDQYPNAIIKSINGSKGESIYKISKQEEHLVITNPIKDKIHSIPLNKKDEANFFFKKYFTEQEYMIQKAVDLIQHDDRTVDFRVVIAKDQQGAWKDMGIFARHGQPGNILSNLSPTVKSGRETIKTVCQLGDQELNEICQEIFRVSIESSKVLEKDGINFGNTGVDIAVDKQGKIWIIEIQHCNPSHNIAMKAGMPDLYYNILKSNMLFAKRLAGFPL